MAKLDREEREEQELLDPVERKIPFYLRIELYLPLILVGGIIVAVLLYARGMYGAGWQSKLETGGTVAGAFVPTPVPPIVLYASPTTRAFLSRVSASQDVLLKPWRDYFKAHKREFREVNDPKALADLGDAVLVVPSALSLSNAERGALTEFHRKGGSILATGAFGARDGAGEWVGWDLMTRLFGARVTDEVSGTADEQFIVTVGDSPITVAFPAGSRFWVGKPPESPLRFEGGQVAARFMDWARTPNAKAASVVYGEKDGGRWVLFGFSENAWDAAPTPMRTLADGSLDWLQRKPRAVLAPWPDGRSAAHVVTMNVNEEPANAADFAAALDAVKVRGTFFVVAEAGRHAPEVVKALARNNEVAYHGDVFESFKDQPEQQQERRLKEMREQQLVATFWPLTRINGFRAPEEGYDKKTEQILQKMGFRYHAVDPNRGDARLPIFAKANGAKPADDLVALPRTQRDDLVYLHSPDAKLDEISALMSGELKVVLEQGGLGMLSLHSRNYTRDGLLAQAVPSYLVALVGQKDRVWIATANDVAEWWRKREEISVKIAIVGQRQELEISNTGGSSVEGVTAIVYHPRASQVVVGATKAWTPEATVRRIDDFRSLILFGSVRSGHYAYKLVFE